MSDECGGSLPANFKPSWRYYISLLPYSTRKIRKKSVRFNNTRTFNELLAATPLCDQSTAILDKQRAIIRPHRVNTCRVYSSCKLNGSVMKSGRHIQLAMQITMLVDSVLFYWHYPFLSHHRFACSKSRHGRLQQSRSRPRRDPGRD